MAETNFKLEPNSGTGNSTVKVTPKSSKPLDNTSQEEYDLKVDGKILDKVRFKIVNVPKDRFVPKTNYNLLRYATKENNTPDYREYETYLINKRSFQEVTDLKGVRTLNILHSFNRQDPNFLNLIREAIWVYDYRVKHFLNLNSLYNYYKEIRNNVLPKDRVQYQEDLILNRAYFGDILIDTSKLYKFGEDLNKNITDQVFIAPQDILIIRLPKDSITHDNNTSTKPYHIKIKWDNTQPLEGIMTDIVKTYRLSDKVTVRSRIESNIGGVVGSGYSFPVNRDEAIQNINGSYLSISCVEEDIDLGFIENSNSDNSISARLFNNAGEPLALANGDVETIQEIKMFSNDYIKNNTLIYGTQQLPYWVYSYKKEEDVEWVEP